MAGSGLLEVFEIIYEGNTIPSSNQYKGIFANNIRGHIIVDAALYTNLIEYIDCQVIKERDLLSLTIYSKNVTI